MILHPGGTEWAYSGGALIVRGLGALWVRTDHGWSRHPDAPLASVAWRDGVLQQGCDAVVQHGEFLVAPTPNGRRALGVVRGDEVVIRHPSGAVALASEVVRAAGAPGRTVAPLPVALLPSSLRVGDRGTEIAGVDIHGTPWRVSLITPRRERLAGPPLGPRTWLRSDGTIEGSPLPYRASEASWARNGSWLAGPGAMCWDLQQGRPISSELGVALGATTPWRDGFVTIDWATHRGWAVATHHPLSFTLPLDDDDTVLALDGSAGTLRVWSAAGRCIDVSAVGAVSETAWCPPPRSPAERPMATPFGELPLAGTTEIGGRRYAWSSDGWLFGWMTTPSTSGDS